MPDKNNNIYLYEALELKNEYQRKINTLENLLPEKTNTGYSGSTYKPEYNVEKVRGEISSLKTKLMKLNEEIQKTNFEVTVNTCDGEVSISTLLARRKELDNEITETKSLLQRSAFSTVTHMEERDIEEKPDLEFDKVYKKLENQREKFREFNRKIRKVQYETTLNFKDEK